MKQASRRRQVLAAVLVAAAILSSSCGEDAAEIGPQIPLPTYQEVRSRFDERADALPRFWCRVVTRVWFQDDRGKLTEEQLEGVMQYVEPLSFSVSFKKLSEEYARMGSNDGYYWWLDRAQDARAIVGSHESAPAELDPRLGFSIYPPDLIDLFGITRLPDADGLTVERKDGQFTVTVPSRTGSRRVTLDPETLEPVGVELLDEHGAVLMRSILEGHAEVEMRADLKPRLPGVISIEFVGRPDHARLHVHAPENKGWRPTPAAFDLGAHLRAYAVPPGRIEIMDAAAQEFVGRFLAENP